MGCRRQAPLTELVRVVADPDGTLRLGRTLEGRGAWLCAASLACVRLADRRKAYSRALRTTVAPTAALELEAQFLG